MADQDPAAPLAILLAARRQGRARHRDARRRAAEAGLRGAGLGAIWLALGLLALLLGSVLVQGLPAFRAAYIKLDINFDPARLAPEGDPTRLAPDGETAAAALAQADYAPLVAAALERLFPELADREQRRLLRGLVSIGAADELRRRLLADPGLLGQTRAIWLLADDDVDQLLKGRIDRAAPAADRRLSDRALSLIDRLAATRSVDAILDWLRERRLGQSALILRDLARGGRAVAPARRRVHGVRAAGRGDRPRRGEGPQGFGHRHAGRGHPGADHGGVARRPAEIGRAHV